jgi:L-cystine uptake protein TcyP (sodium:dicarboxylate symporter family)
MSKSDKASKNQNSFRKRNSYLWLSWVMILSLVIFSPASLPLLGIGMLPSIITAIFDRKPRKTALQTIACANFCGVIIFCVDLWKNENNLEYLGTILQNHLNWLIMYGSALMGLMTYIVIPLIIALLLDAKSSIESSDLKRQMQALRDEWGPEVAEENLEVKFMPLIGVEK